MSMCESVTHYVRTGEKAAGYSFSFFSNDYYKNKWLGISPRRGIGVSTETGGRKWLGGKQNRDYKE